MSGGGRGGGRPELLLALETSSGVGSVAVGGAGRVLARGILAERERHSARLLPVVHETLEEAGVGRRELQGIVVGSGPGSFTGVRVAAATAKGFAWALGLPLWSFSSLAAAAVAPEALVEREVREAYGAGEDGLEGLDALRPRLVLFDARGERVYAACYRVSEAGRLTVVREPEATTLPEILAGELPEGVLFAGDAALRHRRQLEDLGHAVVPPPLGLPTADGLLHLLAADPDAEPVPDRAGWEPAYLRPSGAERIREEAGRGEEGP